jgi:hypothetical protein
MEKTGTDCLGLVQVLLKFSLVHSQGQHYCTGIHAPKKTEKEKKKKKKKQKKKKKKKEKKRERKDGKRKKRRKKS